MTDERGKRAARTEATPPVYRGGTAERVHGFIQSYCDAHGYPGGLRAIPLMAVLELLTVLAADRTDAPSEYACPNCGRVLKFNEWNGSVCPYCDHILAERTRAEATPPAERLGEIAHRLSKVYEGFHLEAMNGVICSIPDEGLDTPPHRTWCARCRTRWRMFKQGVDDLSTLLAALREAETPQAVAYGARWAYEPASPSPEAETPQPATSDDLCVCGHVMSRHFNYGACVERGAGPSGRCLCERFKPSGGVGAALREAETPHPLQWQPIETAPKDRRWVLVWAEHLEYSVYRFGPGLYDDDNPDWTHWIPLPDPPAVGDAAARAVPPDTFMPMADPASLGPCWVLIDDVLPVASADMARLREALNDFDPARADDPWAIGGPFKKLDAVIVAARALVASSIHQEKK